MELFDFKVFTGVLWQFTTKFVRVNAKFTSFMVSNVCSMKTFFDVFFSFFFCPTKISSSVFWKKGAK